MHQPPLIIRTQTCRSGASHLSRATPVGITRQFGYWIDQGSLPAHRVGRRVRIRRSDLDRMLEQGYTIRTSAMTDEPGQPIPSGEDFWGGELADPWDGAASAPSVK